MTIILEYSFHVLYIQFSCLINNYNIFNVNVQLIIITIILRIFVSRSVHLTGTFIFDIFYIARV